MAICSKGTYTYKNKEGGIFLYSKKKDIMLILFDNDTVLSAYKSVAAGSEEYSAYNNDAREIYSKLIKKALGICNNKNSSAIMTKNGVGVRYRKINNEVEYTVDKFNNEIYGVEIIGGGINLYTEYSDRNIIPDGIPYIQLTSVRRELDNTIDNEDEIIVRSVDEIILEKKDITWLKNKKYYVVNNEETAEKIFKSLDNYKGIISYDVETSGLNINIFSKVYSKEQEILNRYNEKNSDNKRIADYLVGVILCVKEGISYYFPVKHRKFKNLYEGDSITKSLTLKKIREEIKKRGSNSESDIARLFKDKRDDEIPCDVILMERLRHILTKGHIGTHGGSMEYKVGLCYEIDTNIQEDSMVLHQLMFKFRDMSSERGEPSNLKHLALVELGIEQWDLKDFFPQYVDDSDKTAAEIKRKKKKKKDVRIDFSYMEYEGTRVYGPADGDMTLSLINKYRRYLLEEYVKTCPRSVYLYRVEVLVLCSIGMMEFYGHRVDENRVKEITVRVEADMAIIESKIRKIAEIQDSKEEEQRRVVEVIRSKLNSDVKDMDKKERGLLVDELERETNNLKSVIESGVELNLSSPKQVAELFYDKMGVPVRNGEKNVAAKTLKQYKKERIRNEDGKEIEAYPVVNLYSEYTKMNTVKKLFLLPLPEYMFPGGFIFSKYVNMVNTGRMACSKPNAQQYNDIIKEIVIPRDGAVMCDADYSQIELRVMAGEAGETKSIDMYQDPDVDCHTGAAALMWDKSYEEITNELRTFTKRLNFGIPYGMLYKSLALILHGVVNDETIEDAKNKYNLYFANRPLIKEFFDRTKEKVRTYKMTKTRWDRVRRYKFEDKDGVFSSWRLGSAMRQGGNAVIQGTAADIFKIGVARLFVFIRKNKLFGKLMMVNMVHDEVLNEIMINKINPYKALEAIGHAMMFDIPDYPAIFIGAGFGMSWYKAKSKEHEIHVHLLEELKNEHKDEDLNVGIEMLPIEFDRHMSDKIMQFKIRKVSKYLTDSNNWGKKIHTSISSLLVGTFGLRETGDDVGIQYIKECAINFIDKYKLDVDINSFEFGDNIGIKESDVEEVEINEDDGVDGVDGVDGDESDLSMYEYILYNEKDEICGITLNELINLFGVVIHKNKKICAIDARGLDGKQRYWLSKYIEKNVCDQYDEGACEVQMLNEVNVIKKSGIYVKNISEDLIKRVLNKSIREEDVHEAIRT